METLIVGIFINIYTWNNADFFVQKKNNERQMTCQWVDEGWQKTDPKNPSLNVFGYVKYKQRCTTKEKD